MSLSERHWVQLALMLLLLFGTECGPAELVDAREREMNFQAVVALTKPFVLEWEQRV